MTIEPRYYQHPEDRESLVNLRAIKWFEGISKTLVAEDLETDFLLLNLSDNLMMTAETFPECHAYLIKACEVLGVTNRPRLFLDTRPEPNSLCIGEQRPMILLTSGLMDLLEPDELEAVIAHEVGHLACGHAYYKLLAENFAGVEQLSGIVPGLGVAAVAAKIPLYDWYRKADLSADRAAWLVTGNCDLVVRKIGKIAGGSGKLAGRVPTSDLIKQAEEIDTIAQDLKSGSLRQKASYLFSNIAMQGMFRTQPWPSVRIREIIKWSESNDAKQLLSGQLPDLPNEIVNTAPDSSGFFGRWSSAVQDAAKSVMFWESADEQDEAGRKG